MARYKIPSQAASGKDSFSDELVGNQFTTDSSLMTGANFAVEKAIPQKDSKNFITQPFSDFLTLDSLKEETTTTTDESTSISNEKDIKFNNDKLNADRSLYGSLKQRILVSITNIISKYPAAVFVDGSSPIGLSNATAERIIYNSITNTTEFLIQYSLLYNPFGILLKQPKSDIRPKTDNPIRDFFSSYTKYCVDVNGNTFNIVSCVESDTENKIILTVEGNCFEGYVGYYENYLIRPNNGIVENFYNELDDLERVLINRETYPKFNASFNVPRDTNDGNTTETITVYANWPISKDGWNIQIVGLDYENYLETISSYAEEIDNYKSNLIVRFLTAPQLYEFDTEEQKAESIFQIYGQSFDRVKKFIDNIAYMRNVSYDGINNVPDVLLKNLAETLGLSTIGLFDEKTLQDFLYTRHESQYDGIPTGLNLIEAEYEFYRRLLVNLAWLYKSKGTRRAIEFFLKFIGAPEPMIKLNEYVYKVEGLLPSKTVEDDIRDAIQGVKITNVVEYIETPEYTGYKLVQLTGATSLSRDRYPVDPDTGLPKSMEYTDGSMFFAKGAGWYQRTLDHRSSDILDVANSDLTGRIKIIKTMPKLFTYGEDYFDVYRQLPGLDYGYTLSSAIDNKKTELVEDENVSKLTLNRKNITIFVSADRAIDYDIYTKSKELMVWFKNLPPQTGVTFAEFVDNITNTIISNSHVIKYKPAYIDLEQVYNSYQQSVGFTPYNYITVNDFVNRLNPYWIKIIEQFIPSTTQWIGGNVIGNGLFNRSKFSHQQPCVPMVYNYPLYPDFSRVIDEELVNNSDYFRGLQLFGGISFSINLNYNGIIYSGVTDVILPFTAFTPTSECTILTPTSESIPLICDYHIIKDNTIIEQIKYEWKRGLIDLIEHINTTSTDQTITLDFYLNTELEEWVRFTVLSNDYYGCTGYEILDYYFIPIIYGLNGDDIKCHLEVGATTTNILYCAGDGCVPPDCQLVDNITFDVIGVGDEMGNGPFYVRTGCTGTVNAAPLEILTCDYRIQHVKETDHFDIIFTDASNCEQRITFDGLQLVVVNPPGYGSLLTGITNYPMVMYKPTYNYGIQSGTTIYSATTDPSLWTSDLQTAIEEGDVVEVYVEDILIGSTILGVRLKSYSEMSTQDFDNISTNGCSFAFDYYLTTISAIECLTTTKINIINDMYYVLPTSKLLVYTNIDTNLKRISPRFEYKNPEDLYINDGSDVNDDSYDYLIDEYGSLIQVVKVDLNICSTDNYQTIYYQLNFEDSDGTNIVYNGPSGEAPNKIVVSYQQETIDPLTFNLRQYFITDIIDESHPINTTYYRDFSIVSGYTVCAFTGATLPTPSISQSPVESPMPSISATPSITPTMSITPSISESSSTTPSISASSSITPSMSISNSPTSSVSASTSITPSLSVSNTPTPSISYSQTPGLPPSESRTPSISLSNTPSISTSNTSTPSISLSKTPSISLSRTPSISRSSLGTSYIKFNSLDGEVAVMGGTNIGGRTFNITFRYTINTYVDNNWSGGPVQAATYLQISRNGGSTWEEIDYVTAEIPGSSYETVTSYYTIHGITNLQNVRVRTLYDCAWAQDQQGGNVDVSIVSGTTDEGAPVVVVCDNRYYAGCLTTAALLCGPEVSKSPSPTRTATPTIGISRTPTPTRTPLPIYIGFDNNGNITFNNLKNNIVSLQVRITAEACQYWQYCNSPPEAVAAYSYQIDTQILTDQVFEWRATEYNPSTCNRNVKSWVYTNIYSGSTLTASVSVNNDYYCGRSWGEVTVELLGVINTQGNDWILIDPLHNVYVYNQSTPDASKSATPSKSVSSSRTPSISKSRTPSITPSISRSPSRTPSVTPVAIYINIVNNSNDNIIENVTVDGYDVFSALPNFPYYPGDSGVARSPLTTGYRTVGCFIRGNGIAKYARIVDSTGAIHCVNIRPDAPYFAISNIYMGLFDSITITLMPSGSCPSPSPSRSATPSITPSRSLSRTRTPSLSVSRSVSKSPAVSQSVSRTRTPSQSPAAYSISIDPVELVFDKNGSPYFGNTVGVRANGSWTATVISGGDIISNYNPHSGTGNATFYVTILAASGGTPSMATIRFTCGSSTTDLTICRDGTFMKCAV